MKLKKQMDEAWLCNHCSMCSEMVCDEAGFYKVCPVYQVMEFEDYSARGHNTIALYLLEGSLKYSKEVSDVLFKCATCGICEEVCKPMGNAVAALGGSGLKSVLPDVLAPLGMELNPVKSVTIMEAMRADCVDQGLQPEALKTAAANLEKTGNADAKPAKDRAKWAEGLDLAAGSATVLFAGSTASYETPEVAQAAAKVLKSTGVRVSLLAGETDSGALMFRTGNTAVAEKLAKANVEALKAAGASEVIALSADDFFAMKTDWVKSCGELPFKVRHISQVLAELLAEGRLSLNAPLNMRVTYQDPCHLGRGMGVYRDPRDVIEAIPGVTFVDMYPTAHAAWCCGSCGGVPIADPALSMDLGKRKLPLVDNTGASVIVSTCPEVKAHMNKVLAQAGSSLKAKDLTELVAESMGV